MANRVVILGAGESGVGAAILAKKQGADTFVSDFRTISDTYKSILKENQIPFEENQHSKELIFSADTIVKSPGIPDKVPLIKELEEKSISVISEIEYAFQHLSNNAKIIAITGTNGKTTTTLLTYHILKSSGLNVGLGGNIGTSFAKLVATSAYDYYVLEISSFQLDGIKTFKPNVSIILNITPDHLDRYDYNIQNYAKSKLRIFENQSKEEALIYNQEDDLLVDLVNTSKTEVQKKDFSTKNNQSNAYFQNGKLIFNKSFELIINEIPLIGQHNFMNVMAATLATREFGVSEENIKKAIHSFKNAPHRLEKVAEIDGVTYINDSKATNVDAVYYALEGIQQQIVWIVGGVDKGNDYTQIEELVKEKVKAIICLGTDNSAIKKKFGGKIIPLFETQNVNKAVALANQAASSGDVVLLSPACASFDLFKNYIDRGHQFKRAVHDLMVSK